MEIPSSDKEFLKNLETLIQKTYEAEKELYRTLKTY